MLKSLFEKGKIDNSDYKRRNSDKGVSLRNTMYNTVLDILNKFTYLNRMDCSKRRRRVGKRNDTQQM